MKIYLLSYISYISTYLNGSEINKSKKNHPFKYNDITQIYKIYFFYDLKPPHCYDHNKK